MREARGEEGTELPPEVVRVIQQVLNAAELDLLDGRREVEEDLRSHFADGLGGRF